MMVLTVYTSVLFLFGMQSIVSGTPVPEADQNLKVDIAMSDNMLVMGKLGKTGQTQTSAPMIREDNSLTRRKVFPWGPGLDQNEALRLHNAARINLGVGALSWDTTLEYQARLWAEHLAEIQDLQLDDEQDLGANVAVRFSTQPISNPITLSTKGWLAKAQDYHNEVIPHGDFKSYATYTQCVWKTTNRVGIATASDGNGSWYTVGYYSPSGNIIGMKPY